MLTLNQAFLALTQFSIVFGSLGGKLESAFAKLATLHAKNNFSFAIVSGNLFDDSSDESDAVVARLLNGEIQVPLPTYFTVGTTPLPPQVIERIEKDEEVSRHLIRFLLDRGMLILILDMREPTLPRQTQRQ